MPPHKGGIFLPIRLRVCKKCPSLDEETGLTHVAYPPRRTNCRIRFYSANPIRRNENDIALLPSNSLSRKAKKLPFRKAGGQLNVGDRLQRMPIGDGQHNSMAAHNNEQRRNFSFLLSCLNSAAFLQTGGDVEVKKCPDHPIGGAGLKKHMREPSC